MPMTWFDCYETRSSDRLKHKFWIPSKFCRATISATSNHLPGRLENRQLQVNDDGLVEPLAPTMRPVRRRNRTVDDASLPPTHAATQSLSVTPHWHIWVPAHTACTKPREGRGSRIIEMLASASLALALSFDRGFFPRGRAVVVQRAPPPAWGQVYQRHLVAVGAGAGVLPPLDPQLRVRRPGGALDVPPDALCPTALVYVATDRKSGSDPPQGPTQALAAQGASFGDGLIAVGIWRGVRDDNVGA